ncbi:MAG: hypothetical protein EP335_01520 [Alphaproteobacteria bacterium]|nr:MAG: hypothetical protein EP335_01520 [Alphaproteobacteria bacterium]
MSLTEKIIRAYETGTVASLEGTERPDSLEAAEQAQDRVLASLGFVAAAWKLGASNQASRKGLGLPRPFSGLLRVDDMLPTGGSTDITTWRQRGVECEPAVRFATDLPARPGVVYSEARVAAAIGSLHPALEIPHTRFRTLATTEGPFALVADNGASGKCVIGRANGASITSIADMAVSLRLDGEVAASGTLQALIDRPLALVCDHVNRITARGHDVKAGDYVLLGSLTPYTDVPGPCHIEADFGDFGKVSITYR